MKKILIAICLLFLSHTSYTQQHEIGLGLGYAEYNPYRYHLTLNPEAWNIYTPFRNTIIPQTNKWRYNPEMLKLTKFAQTPTIYYQFRFYKKMSLRASYFYNSQKGENKVGMLNFERQPTTYHFETKSHFLSLGIAYYLNKDKKLSPYIATDAELFVSRKTENDIPAFPSFVQDHLVDENTIISSNYREFRFNQVFGIQYAIKKNISIKYEVSARLENGDLRLRPLNRLSLNYQF